MLKCILVNKKFHVSLKVRLPHICCLLQKIWEAFHNVCLFQFNNFVSFFLLSNPIFFNVHWIKIQILMWHMSKCVIKSLKIKQTSKCKRQLMKPQLILRHFAGNCGLQNLWEVNMRLIRSKLRQLSKERSHQTDFPSSHVAHSYCNLSIIQYIFQITGHLFQM